MVGGKTWQRQQMRLISLTSTILDYLSHCILGLVKFVTGVCSAHN